MFGPQFSLDIEFEYRYDSKPVVPVSFRPPGTQDGVEIEALIDTGSDRSLLDLSIAHRLGLDLNHSPPMAIRVVGNRITEIPTAAVELAIFSFQSMRIVTTVGFVEGLEGQLGNLLGLDVLEHVDIGVSHARRLIYVGMADA